MRALALASLVVTALACAGCYLWHERADAVDASAVDAGALRCDSLVVMATQTLDEGVTPRIVALPGGEVGVVYVRTDGDPTRVIYERLGADLSRLTGAVSVATDAFTWAEIDTIEGEVLLAYGLDSTSVLHHLTPQGAVGARQPVALAHPSVFERTAGRTLLWGASHDGVDGVLELAHVSVSGALAHPPATIDLGRYGSGHHAVTLASGGAVVGYPREGPAGVRHGYVRRMEEDGTLGPEHLLDPDEDDRVVIPVLLGEDLAIVRGAGSLVVEPTRPSTLERLGRVALDAREGTLVAGALGARLVVGSLAGGTFSWSLFSDDLSRTTDGRAATGHPGNTAAWSAASFSDAVVFALGVADGPSARPWLVRLACAPRS